MSRDTWRQVGPTPTRSRVALVVWLRHPDERSRLVVRQIPGATAFWCVWSVRPSGVTRWLTPHRTVARFAVDEAREGMRLLDSLHKEGGLLRAMERPS